jgi:hypothetical protein
MSRSREQLTPRGYNVGTASIDVSLTYPANFTRYNTSARFFVPKTANGVLDLAILIKQGGPQHLTATPSMAVATMGVPGVVTVRTAVHNSKGVNASTFMTGINTLVRVPLSVGVPGQFTGSFLVLGINHLITVDFYGWTPGTRVFRGLTTKGVALPTVTAAGSWNLPTSEALGTVTLVAPTKISIDGSLFQRRTAGITSLKLYFVPEPSTLLLLSAGALALALVGIRKG